MIVLIKEEDGIYQVILNKHESDRVRVFVEHIAPNAKKEKIEGLCIDED